MKDPFTAKQVKVHRKVDLEQRALDEYKEICLIYQYSVNIKIRGKRYDYVHLFKNPQKEDMDTFLKAANKAYWRTKKELKSEDR